MTKYRVTFAAVANAVVEVEAEDENDAVELAYLETPRPNYHWPDVGEWELASDIFPAWYTTEEAVEEIE